MSCRNLPALLLLVLILPACGRKGPPKPPPSRIPAAISDLSIQQRGREILLTMSYPNVTLGGLPIEDLEAVEIWEMSRILSALGASAVTGEESAADQSLEEGESIPPADDQPAATQAEAAAEEIPTDEPEASLFSLPTAIAGAQPEASMESLVDVKDREFASLAALRRELRGPDLQSAVVGDKILIRLPLEEIPGDAEPESAVSIFAARSVAGKRLSSPFSNLVKIRPREPPAAPRGLEVQATPVGVEVGWEDSAAQIGYRVYRRYANVREYGEPLTTVAADALSYLDRSAQFDNRYIYTVTSVRSASPLVESVIAAEHEVDFQDRFAPGAPREVVALAEPGRIRLLWEPSASEDTKGYWIFRQDPGREFQSLNPEPVLGSEYLDRDLASGQTVRYYIVAVDAVGNQSEASEVIEIRVP